MVLLTGDKVMDALERLRKIAEETGEIRSVYGGFEIKVLKPTLFPWYNVLNYLLEIGQDTVRTKS
jgi:hypothetical protein